MHFPNVTVSSISQGNSKGNRISANESGAHFSPLASDWLKDYFPGKFQGKFPMHFPNVTSDLTSAAFAGDVQQAQVWRDEEGLRAERAVRLRDLRHHLQLAQQALPVRLHRHGQDPHEVHRYVRRKDLFNRA